MARTPGWTLPIEEPECPPGWSVGPPDFVGVGAQRCGTTWWYRGAIRPHPGFARKQGRKELQFFVRYWREDPPADLGERYQRLFPRPPGGFSGEWTPRYMYDHWIPPMLRRVAPDARILVLLRDPVERYRSALARELRLAEEDSRPPEIAVIGDAVHRGLYHRQLARLFEHYPREQVLVLQYERCLADPLGEMRRTHRFIGVEPLERIPNRLSRDRPPAPHKRELRDESEAELALRFREDLERLAELCPELDLSLWPTARAAA